MISRKIPKFLKISHHKFTSRKLFSHIFPKYPKTGNQVFPNIPRFSHFGKYIPFCVGIPILGKVGKPAKTKLVRAAPELHTMENNGENLGIFGKFFPNFPKREIFFPKKLLFLTVQYISGLQLYVVQIPFPFARTIVSTVHFGKKILK